MNNEIGIQEAWIYALYSKTQSDTKSNNTFLENGQKISPDPAKVAPTNLEW